MHLRATASLLLVLAASGCGGNAKKPSDADVAVYLAQSEPSYLHVSNVKTSFEPASALGRSKLPDGSWRVHVTYTLHATQDLYAPDASAAAQRRAFDQAVNGFELYRLPRIQAVEQLALRAGLMRQGDATPEPAVAVSLKTHANQDLPDGVTLLAQPDGASWKFAQLDAQSLPDDAIGAPLEDLKRTSAHTVFVMAGSDEDRAYLAREQRFIAALAKAEQPPAAPQ